MECNDESRRETEFDLTQTLQQVLQVSKSKEEGNDDNRQRQEQNRRQAKKTIYFYKNDDKTTKGRSQPNSSKQKQVWCFIFDPYRTTQSHQAVEPNRPKKHYRLVQKDARK